MTNFSLQTLVTSQHPNELFRFVHLRPAIPAKEAQEKALFFTYDWDWAKETSLFLHTVRTIRNNWQPWSVAETAALAFKAGTDYIGDDWSLASIPNAHKLLNIQHFLTKNLDKTTLAADFDVNIKNILGVSIADYLADAVTHKAELKIWDNIIVAAMFNDPSNMLLKMVKCLTVLHTLKQFAATPNGITGATTATNSDIKTWFSAQILVADWIYEVFERREADLKQNADTNAVSASNTATPSDEVDLSVPDFIKYMAALEDLQANGWKTITYPKIGVIPSTKPNMSTFFSQTTNVTLQSIGLAFRW